VTQNDTTFRDLVADLKQMGIYDATAIVLISDHGDEFFDHGSVGHGHSLYQELIDVPMEIRFPPRMPEGKRVAQSVEVIDLTPTLLDLAGIDPGEEEQGQSLLPIAADDGPEMARPAESFHDGAIRSLRLGRWKLILWAGGRLQLYDLAADPGEKHDRSGDRPIALRWLRNVFAYYHAYNERWRKARWGVASDLKPAFADDLGM
jgi:arylsulfatase A-like enzyme